MNQSSGEDALKSHCQGMGIYTLHRAAGATDRNPWFAARTNTAMQAPCQWYGMS